MWLSTMETQVSGQVFVILVVLVVVTFLPSDTLMGLSLGTHLNVQPHRAGKLKGFLGLASPWAEECTTQLLLSLIVIA